jgi:hypothetical protein
MAHFRLGLSKNIIGAIAVAALLPCGLDLAAAERLYRAVDNSAASGTNREPLPRALQVEEPITSGTPFSWEDADKVQNGMTEAEVVAILGQPYSRRESGDDAILIWSHTSSVGGSNALACRFLNGRVTGTYRVKR